MTENRRIALDVVATYELSLYALVVRLFCGRWMLMAFVSFLNGPVSQAIIGARPVAKYSECRFCGNALRDRWRLSQLFVFAGGRAVNALSSLLGGDGMVIVVNKYLKPAKNAAMLIGNTVSSHASSLSASLCGAFQPAITTAADEVDFDKMRHLVFYTCRFLAAAVAVGCVPRTLGVVEVLGLSFHAMFLALLLVLSCAGFFVGLGINCGCFALSFVVVAVLSCVITLRRIGCGCRTLVVAGLALLGVFAGFFCLSAKLYDYSYDGRAYHQMLVWLLRSGCNPIRESAGCCFSSFYPAVAFGSDAFALEDLYVKGVEILEANFYQIFESLELSKVVNLLVVFLSWLLVRLSLRERLKADGFWNFCLSTVVALPPVAVSQMFTFYVDLHVYAGFVLLLVSACWFVASEGKLCPSLAVIASGTFLSSVKPTGSLYLGIVGLVLLVVVLQRRKQLIGKLLLVGMTCGLMCGLCQANPYLQNVVAGRHLFHPLMGTDSITGGVWKPSRLQEIVPVREQLAFFEHGRKPKVARCVAAAPVRARVVKLFVRLGDALRRRGLHGTIRRLLSGGWNKRLFYGKGTA